MASRLPEDVLINISRSVYQTTQHSPLRSTALRSTVHCSAMVSRLSFPRRHASTFCRSITHIRPSNRLRTLCNGAGAAALQWSAQNLNYSTANTSQEKPREIAVLGAGITGLTTAHYLARHAKNAHITIYEASNAAGGWINGTWVDVEDHNGSQEQVLLHKGPRMLRSSHKALKYDDLVLFDVLASLNMTDKLRHPQSVAGHRYVYYPDHLVKLPSPEASMENLARTVQSVLTEPIWSGLFTACYNYWTYSNKALNPNKTSSPAFEDVSVAQYLTKVLKDDRIIKNLVSGMMHGIYGGDINKLSAKHTVLERMVNMLELPPVDEVGHDWINKKELYLMADMLCGPNRLKIIELAEMAVSWRLMAFEDGLLSLVDGLVIDLETKSNVTFKYGEPVTALKHNGKDGVMVTTSKTTKPVKYDHIISTLFSKHLAQVTEPRNALPSLAETHAVTIMVVNLWYSNPSLLEEGGFGYLIPSSTPDNHECALGVLFDSDLNTGSDEAPGTKLTVMLGGHYWDGWQHHPSEELGIAMAKEVVQRQLGINEDEHVVAEARLCRDCLPQHFVGHRERLKDAHYEILSTFQGQLTVAGPSYTSVGVIPSMRAGYDAAMRVARGHTQPWFRLRDYPNPGMKRRRPEIDWWHALGGTKPGSCPDFIGASGLEQFTEDDRSNLISFPRDELLFRLFTKPQNRFRHLNKNYLQLDQRLFVNAPPGAWGRYIDSAEEYDDID